MQRLSMPESKSNPQSSLRCHHCAGPLTKEMETSQWTVRPLIRDSFSMIGSAVGGTTSAFYGFNHVMPVVRRWVKGPMWLHFFIGAPPVIVFSSACAGLAGICWVDCMVVWCLFWHIAQYYMIKLYGPGPKGQNQLLAIDSVSFWVTAPFEIPNIGNAIGGAVPALAQLASSSYHAAFSAPSLPPPSQDDKRQKSRNSSTL